MAQQNRDAHAPYFCRVDPIASDTRTGFDDGGDFNACLHQLITNYKADVSCSNHEDSFSGQNTVNIHESLYRAGSVNAGKIVVREGNKPFLRSSCNNGFLWFYLKNFLLAPHGREGVVFGVITCDCRVLKDRNAVFEGIDFVEQDICNFVTAGSGIFILTAEELVSLFDELASEAKIAFDD